MVFQNTIEYNKFKGMAESFSAQVHEIITCAVCMNIPRKLPLSGCVSGHVICSKCSDRMFGCPICRRRISSEFQNVTVGKIIEIAQHKCSYNTFGCEHLSTIDKIALHEKDCLFRSVVCPWKKCRQEVEVRKFQRHAMVVHSAIDIDSEYGGGNPDEDPVQYPYILTKEFDGCSDLHDGLFEEKKNGEWKLLVFSRSGRDFYASLTYLGHEKGFVLYFMTV